jgi:hypothetical protein
VPYFGPQRNSTQAASAEYRLIVGICAAGITPSRAALIAHTSDPDRPELTRSTP